MLIARKDPRRHPRVAAPWLLRYLEDCDEATVDEAANDRSVPRRAGRGSPRPVIREKHEVHNPGSRATGSRTFSKTVKGR